MKKRTVALIITLSMLITILPNNIILGSVADYNAPGSEYIGAVAKIIDDNFPLADNPSDFDGTHLWMNIKASDVPDRVIITDYYYNETAENSEPMYEIDAAAGYTWPKDLKNYHWIEAKSVEIIAENGETGVLDGEGKPADIVALKRYDRIGLFAKSSLRGEVSYQWQIRYDTPKDLWVDIEGEDGTDINVTYGMILSLIDEFRSVAIRCESTSVDKTNYSEPVTVTSIPFESELGETALAASVYDTVSSYGVGRTATRSVDTPDTRDVVKTYNVVINYKYENGEAAYQSRTATIAEGTSYSDTVTFPTIQGYLPYVDDTQRNSYTFAISGISADVTVEVVYKPTEVKYMVLHYQQNVDNDDYSLVSTETKYGLTGSAVPESHKSYDGFYNLVYERPAIAADGSTIIEIYYDRYYYLLNFDMQGGYGTEPVYARYGTAIPTTVDPTRTGYEFKGWSETEDGTDPVAIPTTMPAYESGEMTYYAIWKMVDIAKVTIVFWGENPNDEYYSYLDKETKKINLKPGTEFTYTEAEMLICGKDVHTHTEECYSCTKKEHTHSAVGGSCYSLVCAIENHTHSTGCYDGVGSTAIGIGKPNNPSEGQVYKGGRLGTYIYIGGTWYDYSGSTASGSIAPTTCGKEAVNHTHGEACYEFTCETEEHTHTKECYSCGKEQHTHTSACYMQGAGLGSEWKFIKSDTVIVNPDGSTVVNVYYDRKEFTLTFKYNYQWGNYTSTGTITAKWGEDISTRYNAMSDAAGNNMWSRNSDGGSPWTAYLQIMPTENRTYYMNSTSGSAQTATYYIEKLDSTNSNNVNNYEVKDSITSKSSKTLGITDEDAFEIEGFTFVFGYEGSSSNRKFTQNSNGVLLGPDGRTLESYDVSNRKYSGSKFYYKRNEYTLTFNNGFEAVKSEKVKYEASLGTYKDYVPEVPSEYEPGSVVFAGWYQNPQCTGDEYKLDEHTMPANDIILYAKWQLVNRTVEFHLTEATEEIYHPDGSETDASFTVPHGGYISEDYVGAHLAKKSMNDAKPNGDYVFVYWYYINENGEKIPFDPTTSIRRDLVLYGAWSSNVLKEYTVMYVLQDDHNVRVASDTHGSGLAGTPKTFEAKGAEQLYTQYQEGYFPTVKSKSIHLDINENEIVIVFEYVEATVPYTVKYIDKETGDSLRDDKVVSDNKKAVVTETFVQIDGYMPDAYQKRLVVSADGVDNVIIFYYTRDTEHAYYKVTHYIQNADGKTWTEYSSSQAVGDIGTRYTASPMTIQGFEYDHINYVADNTEIADVTDEGAKLTEKGLEINLYYVRNEYPYKVRYLEQDTGNVLHDPKYGTGLYGQTVTESAIDIEKYDKVAPTTQSFVVHIEESDTEPAINVITFYYTVKTVTINYVVAIGDGTVDPASETIALVGQTPVGSTPTAADGYGFDGWYTDAACTVPVSSDLVAANGKISPEAKEATYYAKFVPANTSLKIVKSFPEGEDYSEVDPNQTFIFDIKGVEGTATEGISLTVTVHGAGEITVSDLPIGTYVVTEQTDWSWRYEPTGDENSKTVTLSSTSANKVEFTNERKEDKWLDGDSSCVNIFSGKAETK